MLLVTHGAAWLAVKTEGAVYGRVVKCATPLFLACVVLAVATSVATHRRRLAGLRQRARRLGGGGSSSSCSPARCVYTFLHQRKEGTDLKAFLGSAVIVVALAGIAGVGNYPDIIPARGTPESTSLTVDDAASETLTLKVMLVIALIGVPLVLVYTAFVYRTFRGKVKAAPGEY